MQSAAMTAADIHRTILAVWRIEQPRLITGLSRMLRDVTLAEDLTQEALVAALEHWPVTGVPERPGAWLMATAKRRALDDLRRRRMLARKHEMLIRDLEQEQQAMPDPDAGARRRVRRRTAAADLHRLPSAPVARGARGARTPDDLRPDHGRDRARLPAAGGDHCPAHRAREADAVGIRARLRNPARRGAFGTARLGAGGRLSHLQRGLHGCPRRRMAAAAALQRCAAHGPRADAASRRRKPKPTACSR